MSIHVFGDSHGSNIHSGWRDCNGVLCNHLGPMLCYTFGNKKGRFNIDKYRVRDNDTIIFCFGEIDCRCHIWKYINVSRTYENIIDDIIEKYVESIKRCTNNRKLKNICIYNVVPPIEKKRLLGIENKDYPLLGSDEERRSYVLYFNKCIERVCNENGWIFFDVYDKYINERGYLKDDLSDGNIHIRDGRYLKEFIERNLY